MQVSLSNFAGRRADKFSTVRLTAFNGSSGLQVVIILLGKKKQCFVTYKLIELANEGINL